MHKPYPSFVRFLKMLGRGDEFALVTGVFDWLVWKWGIVIPGDCPALIYKLPEAVDKLLILLLAMAMADRAGIGTGSETVVITTDVVETEADEASLGVVGLRFPVIEKNNNPKISNIFCYFTTDLTESLLSCFYVDLS